MTSKIEVLRQHLRRLYAEHVRDAMIPTSARFLFYELVGVKIISKQATGALRSDQDMLDALTDLRNSREIPWDAIVDETRSLTADQVRDHRLTPIIKIDRRFKNGGDHEAVETEALSQRLIVQIVRDRLDALLPEPLERFLAREEKERVRVRALLNRRQR